MVVEAHGGRIWAESGATGTRDAVHLYDSGGGRGRSRRDAAAPPKPPPAPSGRERTRTLAVDDDPQTLRYVRGAHSDAGYSPIVTGNPEAVARLMEEQKSHLVLLYPMLPGADGIELMKRILKITDMPVIFLSG